MFKNTKKSYGTVTKALHWGMALLVIGLLGVGVYMTGMSASLSKLKIYNLHKSFGVCVLALVIVRILWHIWSRKPVVIESLTVWEKRGACAGHFLLYVSMLGMPLSGWVMSSASGRSVKFFDIAVLPDFVAKGNKVIGGLAHDVHGYLAWGFIALILIHVSAALKHHFVDKDMTLRRMLPFSKGE